MHFVNIRPVEMTRLSGEVPDEGPTSAEGDADDGERRAVLPACCPKRRC